MSTAHPVPSTNEPSLCLEWGIQAKSVLPHPHQVQRSVLCPSPNLGTRQSSLLLQRRHHEELRLLPPLITIPSEFTCFPLHF